MEWQAPQAIATEGSGSSRPLRSRHSRGSARSCSPPPSRGGSLLSSLGGSTRATEPSERSTRTCIAPHATARAWRQGSVGCGCHGSQSLLVSRQHTKNGSPLRVEIHAAVSSPTESCDDSREARRSSARRSMQGHPSPRRLSGSESRPRRRTASVAAVLTGPASQLAVDCMAARPRAGSQDRKVTSSSGGRRARSPVAGAWPRAASAAARVCNHTGGAVPRPPVSSSNMSMALGVRRAWPDALQQPRACRVRKMHKTQNRLTPRFHLAVTHPARSPGVIYTVARAR